MECDVCKQTKNAAYRCDTCRNRQCKACGLLTSSEVKVLELNSRVMKFNCTKCRDTDPADIYQKLIRSKDEVIRTKDKLIATKDRLIEGLEQQIQSQKQEVEDMKIRNQSYEEKLKYSEVVTKQKSCDDVLVIKPKKNQESYITKSVIQEKIVPEEIKAGVSRMKYIKDGGVAISCDKKEDLINVSNSIQKKLGEDYEVTIPKKKCPKIKIINVEEKLLSDQEDFIEKIILQNSITTKEEDRKINILKHYKGKKGQEDRETVVVEVDSNTYSMLKSREKLSIGWKSYRFFDHINVIQCFNCYKYGHIANECRSKKNICPKCAGEHKIDECRTQETSCSNCKYAAEILKVPNVDYNHRAYDRSCQAYKKVYRELEQRINYPDIFSNQK